MRAQLLQRPAAVSEDGPLEAVEFEDVPPAPLELVVEVAACGVCRTDLQLVEGDLSPRRLPIVPGHQAVGRVVAIGAGVEGWSPGDRTGIAWLAGACGSCRFCVDDRENLCPHAKFTGWDRHGGFADRINVRANYALHLPPDRTDLELAPLLCGGVIGYRALKVSGIRPGGRLGLFGFGASALLAIQVATHWGCEVFVATRSATEQRRALELGAVWSGGYDDPIPEWLDAAVTFAPVGSVVVKALQALDRGGVVAINAIHLDGIPAFSYDDLWLERQLRSVANFTRTDAEEFLHLASAIPIETVADVYPFVEANRALAAVKSGTVRGAAVLKIGG
jgi:propanol-preferring alcohol dehydrogenase